MRAHMLNFDSEVQSSLITHDSFEMVMSPDFGTTFINTKWRQLNEVNYWGGI